MAGGRETAVEHVWRVTRGNLSDPGLRTWQIPVVDLKVEVFERWTRVKRGHISL